MFSLVCKSTPRFCIGIESKAHACREEIEKLVQELQSMYRHEIVVDSRCHPRLIGAHGKNIAKIKQDFNVDVCMSF